MRENQEQNEAFVQLHEKMKAEGHDPHTQAGREAIITACIEKFQLGGKNPRHGYRAYLARLADPTKYEGKYAARIKPFQQQRNNKTKPAVEEPAEKSEDGGVGHAAEAVVETAVEAAAQA